MNYDQFLKALIGDRKGYLKLAGGHRERNVWEMRMFRYPYSLNAARHALGEWVDDKLNAYFSPHLYSQSTARKDLALPSNILCADLDDCHPDNLGKYGEPFPSVILETSPNRFQAFWILNITLDIPDLEHLNKRLTYAYRDFGCDPSGWDIGQLLRLPGTTNFKREKICKVIAQHLDFIPLDIAYFSGLPECLVTGVEGKDLDLSGPPVGLNRGEEKLWNQPPDKVKDRSGRIYWMVKTLRKHGLTDAGIMLILPNHPLVKNKYPNRETQEITRILLRPKQDVVEQTDELLMKI